MSNLIKTASSDSIMVRKRLEVLLNREMVFFRVLFDDRNNLSDKKLVETIDSYNLARANVVKFRNKYDLL